MFEFVNRFRRASHPVREADEETPIRVVVITEDDNFYLWLHRTLHNAATRFEWEIRLARNVARGLQQVEGLANSIVIYDWTATASDWRLAIDELTTRANDACVLLASPVVDDYLYTELVRHGGFDVIPRSTDPERLVANVRFACFSRRRSRTFNSQRADQSS
jgi:DNA-binding NtrC family response regulator